MIDYFVKTTGFDGPRASARPDSPAVDGFAVMFIHREPMLPGRAAADKSGEQARGPLAVTSA